MYYQGDYIMEKNNCSDLYNIVKQVEENNKKGNLNVDKIKKNLNDHMRIRIVPKDQMISYSVKPAPYVYYVMQGSYFHYRVSKQGKNNFLSAENAPQWMGIDKVIDSECANITGDKALKECVVLDIKADYFEKCIESDGKFARYIIENLLQKMAKISLRSDRLLFSNAKEHLMFYILEYWDRNNKNSDVCRVDVKNEYIAEEIGVTTRTLYRNLNILKDENLIAVKKGTIVVNSSQIEEIRKILLENDK